MPSSPGADKLSLILAGVENVTAGDEALPAVPGAAGVCVVVCNGLGVAVAAPPSPPAAAVTGPPASGVATDIGSCVLPTPTC